MTELNIPVSMGDDIKRFVYPAGRYQCKLTEIKPIEVKINEQYRKAGDTRAKEPKYLFLFTPIGTAPQPPPGTEGGLSITARPLLGPKSNLRAILSAMHPSGTLPEEYLNDAKCREFMASLVGKFFLVTTRPSEKGDYNDVDTNIMYIPPPAGLSEAAPAGDFSGYPDAQPAPKKTEWWYFLEKMEDEAKKKLAEEMLQANKATFDPQSKLWWSTVELPRLKNLEVDPNDPAFDFIPF